MAACLGPVGSPCGSFPHHLSDLMAPGFAWEPSYGLRPACHSPAGLSLLRHPFASWSLFQRCRNIDLLSIGYALRPHLRVRLTLSGLTFLRKPWVFGERVSRPFSRYSFRHNHFWFVDLALRLGFILQQNAPLPRTTPEGIAHPQLRW